MSGLNKYSDSTWEQFFEFLYPCGENLTQEEMQEDLRKAGIKTDKAMSKIQRALAAAQGKAELATARAQRIGVAERIKDVVGSVKENLRERLNAVIAGRAAAALPATFFKKLETAATDEDLESLLDDIHRLDSFTEEAGDKP